jgi:lysophospholipase L1-like esterase
MPSNNASRTSACGRTSCSRLPRTLFTLCGGALAAFALVACGDGGDEPTGLKRTVSLARATPRTLTHHISLGDSFASGFGAPRSADATEDACGRSSEAWPHLLQRGLPSLPQLTFKACSGATTQNVLPPDSGLAAPDPLAPLADGVPQIEELKAASDPAHTLVTILIGGNDAQTTKLMSSCIGVFGSYYKDPKLCAKDVVTARLNDVVRPRLVTTFRALKAAAPEAVIVAVGYPYLVAAPGRQCNWYMSSVDDATRTIIRDGNLLANQIIEETARAEGILSITQEVMEEFQNHEACSQADDFINTLQVPRGVNPLGVFHPNAAGNAAYARAVAKGLTRLGFLAETVSTTQHFTDGLSDTMPTTPLPEGAVPPVDAASAPTPAEGEPTAAGGPVGSPPNEPASGEPTGYEPTNEEPADYEPTENEPTENEPTENEPTENEPTEYEPVPDSVDEEPTDEPVSEQTSLEEQDTSPWLAL